MSKSIKWGLAITCLVGLVSRSGAQQTQQEQPEYGWKKEIVATLNLTQASFDNWKQGGESSLAWQTSLDMNFDLDEEKHGWANSVKFELGFAKIAGEAARKSADDIKMESVYTRKLGHLLNPFVAVTAQTQFVAGFEFDDNDNKMKISKFLDPGYFTQSLGLGYSPGENFKTRLGATLKETITSDFPKPFTDYTEADLDSFLSTHLKGTYLASQATATQMRKQGGGAIINITTVLALRGVTAVPASAPIAAKGGMNALTRSLAIELAPDNIRVNAIAPGIIKTPIHGLKDEEFEALNGMQPLGRVGEVKDIVDAVLYLADANFITGVVLPVDGGVAAGG